MRHLGLGRSPAGIVAALAMLAGCGSQPPIATPAAMPRTLSEPTQDKHSGPLLYVTNDGEAHDVTVYAANAKDPAPIRVITDGLQFPAGVCLDGQGTLYVADQNGFVAEYHAGKSKPFRVITKGTDNPGFCAIDSEGNLWVANVLGANITEYLKGTSKPHTVITNGLIYPVGIAIDQSGNIYVSNGSFGPTFNIVVYSAGSKSPSRTITDGVTAPVGITVDANGTLYVANDGTNNVEEYRSGQSNPYQTITAGLDHPVSVTVNESGYLYATNFQNTGPVVEYAPGSITPLKRQISKGLYEPWGTAYSPPLLP
jgi:serine/threonine-protein kinase